MESKLTFEVTACSLARKSGVGVLADVLGPEAPRQYQGFGATRLLPRSNCVFMQGIFLDFLRLIEGG